MCIIAGTGANAIISVYVANASPHRICNHSFSNADDSNVNGHFHLCL